MTESFSVADFISTSDLSYRTGFDQAEAGAAAALARLKARSASERAHELVDRVMILHEEYARNARPLFDTFSTMTQAEFLQVVGGLDATRADFWRPSRNSSSIRRGDAWSNRRWRTRKMHRPGG